MVVITLILLYGYRQLFSLKGWMLLVPEMYLLFGVIYVELYLRANRII